MLKLTKKSDYGIIALVHLTRRRGTSVSCREITERYHIPYPTLSNVMKTLAHYEIVESVRGVNGGYRLAVDPKELSLGSLLEVLEGPIKLTECMDLPDGTTSDCKIEKYCPVRAPLRKLHDRFQDWLKELTFAEIAEDSDEFIEEGKQFYEVAHLHGQPVHHATG